MTTRPTGGAFDRPSRIHRRGVSPDLDYPLLPAGSIITADEIAIRERASLTLFGVVMSFAFAIPALLAFIIIEFG